PGGLSAARDQLWNETTTGITNSAQTGDRFGSVLIAGQINNDRSDDLIIGIPHKNVGTTAELREGMARVLYGNNVNGLVTTGTQLLHQGLSNVPGNPAADDRFGAFAAIGDFDNDLRGDLAAGVLNEPGKQGKTGAINVFYGNNSGVNTSSR